MPATEEQGRTFVNNARFGRTETLAALLQEGVDIDFREDGSSTALMAASGDGHLATVAFLVAHGAALDLQDAGSKTALMRASFQGKEDVCRLLIDSGAKLEVEDNQGGTALFLATLTGRVEVVRFLINNGADVDHQMKDGSTALMLAAKGGSMEILELLIANRTNSSLRASTRSSVLALNWPDGMTALGCAIQHHGLGAAATLLWNYHRVSVLNSGVTNADLVTELCDIGVAKSLNKAFSGFFQKDSPLKYNHHPRARAIGGVLQKRGGSLAMQNAHAAVVSVLGTLAGQELSACWDEVGDWLH